MYVDPIEWIANGAGLLWLGLAALYARSNRPEAPDPLRRVPLTAFSFVAGAAAIVIAISMIAGGLGDILAFVLAGALIVGVAALLSALVVDAFAAMLDAVREPKWLAIGIGVAILVTYCWLLLLGRAFIDPGLSLSVLASSPIALVPALVAAATGFVWWSELPRPEEDAPAVFD